MPFIALLLLAQSQGPILVDIHDLSQREHHSGFFVLTAPQDVQITAVGAEPWPDRLRQRDDDNWQDDEQTTWPAAAWILDARTRAVVWDLRSADTRRESNGLRRFAGTVRLPAGTYEAHYASYPGAFSFNGDINISTFGDVIRLGKAREIRWAVRRDRPVQTVRADDYRSGPRRVGGGHHRCAQCLSVVRNRDRGPAAERHRTQRI